MLKIQDVGGFNPFEWEHLRCPLCGGNEFVSLSHAGVYCDDCNCRFVVRDTAGDPGCVIDCFTTREQGGWTYAPAYECEECDGDPKHGLFDWQDHTCPLNASHGAMTRVKSTSIPWKVTDGMERFCMILKLGDYISGWTYGPAGCHKSPFRPTQEQWDAYQESGEFAWNRS